MLEDRGGEKTGEFANEYTCIVLLLSRIKTSER